MKRDNLLVAERVIEKGKAVLKATAEARDLDTERSVEFLMLNLVDFLSHLEMVVEINVLKLSYAYRGCFTPWLHPFAAVYWYT
jgi:hypothetical protein